MADSKDLKPKSFRIDDETAEKFKEVLSKIGGKQQEALSKLIEAYEFQAGKAVLTEKKADIEQFEKYVNALTRMFMGSLEDNQNVTETVRTEFDALLKSKDATIQDLQEKLTLAKQLKEDATAKAKTHADENASLNATIDSMTKDYNTRINDMQNTLDDKTDLVDTLKDACMELRLKVENMQHEHEQFIAISSELEKLKLTHVQLEREKADLQKQLDHDSKEHEKTIADLKQHEVDALERLKEQSQLALDKAILELEKKHQEKLGMLKGDIERLKEQKQNEVDKYQQKYLDLLEQINTQTNRTSILTHYDEAKTMEALKKEGFEEGRIETLVKAVREYMNNSKKDFDTTCEDLEISAEVKTKIKEKI